MGRECVKSRVVAHDLTEGQLDAVGGANRLRQLRQEQGVETKLEQRDRRWCLRQVDVREFGDHRFQIADQCSSHASWHGNFLMVAKCQSGRIRQIGTCCNSSFVGLRRRRWRDPVTLSFERIGRQRHTPPGYCIGLKRLPVEFETLLPEATCGQFDLTRSRCARFERRQRSDRTDSLRFRSVLFDQVCQRLPRADLKEQA